MMHAVRRSIYRALPRRPRAPPHCSASRAPRPIGVSPAVALAMLRCGSWLLVDLRPGGSSAAECSLAPWCPLYAESAGAGFDLDRLAGASDVPCEALPIRAADRFVERVLAAAAGRGVVIVCDGRGSLSELSARRLVAVGQEAVHVIGGAGALAAVAQAV